MLAAPRRSFTHVALGVAGLLAVGLVSTARTEPEFHRRIAPLAPWIAIVDDPAQADSAWTGLAALLPTLPDSVQRGFGWYLMYSAAAALEHVDSMRVAAESSFVYSPADPSGFRSLAQFLARAGHHLDIAERYATRTLQVPGQPIHRRTGGRTCAGSATSSFAAARIPRRSPRSSAMSPNHRRQARGFSSGSAGSTRERIASRSRSIGSSEDCRRCPAIPAMPHRARSCSTR